MVIKGLQKLTLLDFPEKIAATVFTGGCNFRCPFCHNASLVVPEKFADTIPESQITEFLRSRVGRLGGVCISGGEPTLQPDLAAFIRRVRDMGFAVKLDTNGYRPEVLGHLLSEGLLDYVAMDVKNSKAGYAAAVGIPGFDISPIEQSLAILRESGVPYELRTTVVKGLHTEREIEEMGEWIAGAERVFLQTFTDSGDLIGTGLSAPSADKLAACLAAVQPYVPSATLRGSK